MSKGEKVRLQWQDGVGNIQIFEEEADKNKDIRLGEVDVGWAFGVAALAVVIMLALCMMARCRLSLFTRRAKKKKLNKAAVERKKKEKANTESAATDAANAKETAADTKKKEAEKKSGSKFALSKPPAVKKKECLIHMIDSVLEEEDMYVTDLVRGSMDSIDQAGEGQLRRASQASLDLSLVFDPEQARPVFTAQKIRHWEEP